MDWNQDYKPLTKEESSFLEHQDDFVSLYDFQETEWLDNAVEDTLSWCLPTNIMKVRGKPDLPFTAGTSLGKSVRKLH